MDELPQVLDRDVVETTHDGTVLRLAPVFQPSVTPLFGALAAAVAPFAGMLGFVVAAALAWDLGSPRDYFGWYLISVSGATLGGLLTASAAWLLTVHAVRIRLSSRRLRVSWEGGVRPPLDLPLATVRSVELEGPTLVLVTDSGVHRVRIPGRSTRTREAVRGLVRSVRAAIEPGDPRDVPFALRRMRERELAG